MYQSKLEGKATASEQINSINSILHIVRRPSENMLAQAYLRLNLEDQLTTVWHGGVPTLSEFLTLTDRKDSIFYACLVESTVTGDVELAGIGWAVDITAIADGAYRSSSGMAFFIKYQDRTLTVEFCEMMVEDGFTHVGLEVQYGYTPVENRAGCLFHRLMGFQILCIAPKYSTWQGAPCDVQVSVVTKDQWMRRDPAAQKSERRVGVTQ